MAGIEVLPCSVGIDGRDSIGERREMRWRREVGPKVFLLHRKEGRDRREAKDELRG